MSTARGGKKGMGRRPLTRELLLPFTPAQLRALTLPAHLALVALKNGEGDLTHLQLLGAVVCRTDIMGRLSGTEVDESTVETADRVLQQMVNTGEPEGRWSISAEDGEAFARLLTFHDRQLEQLPRRWFFEAQEQLLRSASELSQSELETVPARYRQDAMVALSRIPVR